MKPEILALLNALHQEDEALGSDEGWTALLARAARARSHDLRLGLATGEYQDGLYIQGDEAEFARQAIGPLAAAGLPPGEEEALYGPEEERLILAPHPDGGAFVLWLGTERVWLAGDPELPLDPGQWAAAPALWTRSAPEDVEVRTEQGRVTRLLRWP